MGGDEDQEEGLLDDESDGFCSLSPMQVLCNSHSLISSMWVLLRLGFAETVLVWGFDFYREFMGSPRFWSLVWLVCSWYEYFLTFFFLLFSFFCFDKIAVLNKCVYLHFRIFMGFLRFQI